MNIEQVERNKVYKGGFLFTLGVALASAAVTAGIEKAIEGSGIKAPSATVSRELLKRCSNKLIARKGERLYSVSKEGRGFYLSPFPYGRRDRGLSAITGDGFYLKQWAGKGYIPISRKSNRDTRLLHNAMF